jgi:hypothetical protein
MATGTKTHGMADAATLSRTTEMTRDAAMRYANLWEDMYARN